ncbi:MAG: SpoIID/LytB domain-containing protein [Bacteroidales bacterium]|nr:SpoIID/LytB domain-containing protein [Bacteroidales bacterium]
MPARQKLILPIALLLCSLLSVPLRAGQVDVRIFSSVTVREVNISFDLGTYNLFADDMLLLEPDLAGGRTVHLAPTADGVAVTVNGYDFGVYAKVSLLANDTASIMCIDPAAVQQRTYEGNIHVSCLSAKSLLLVNSVDFETYIAGVVQSEIYGDNTDIFRIQAIISRTWALRNIDKHSADGYNFCDNVHCQAYLNRCTRPDIKLGTMQSYGMTLVDSAGALIETPFHSNSGGQTANSEDVWRAAVPYLRSVVDTFSWNMKQSDWHVTMTENEWLNYFAKKHKVDIASMRDTLLNFRQPTRAARILDIPLTRVRSDFKLKSTFFDVRYDSLSHVVTLYGHGYGHGVGLSQEGCIRMVRLGIAYDSVLRHYYTGARVQMDSSVNSQYVNTYINNLQTIIARTNAPDLSADEKKEDWLRLLFRIRDRSEREEKDDTPPPKEMDSDWQFDW